MTVASHYISGTGPCAATFGPVNISETSHTETSVVLRESNITAEALNGTGMKIAEGTAAVTVQSGETIRITTS